VPLERHSRVARIDPVAGGRAGYQRRSAFRKLVEELLAELESSSEVARPVPENAPGVGWPPPGLDLEARASRKSGQGLFMQRLRWARARCSPS
jgi:hypothetical protein